MLTAQAVKDYAKSVGADIVGIADMNRYEGAPKHADCRYIAPDARTMIVMGFRIPRGTLRGIEEAPSTPPTPAWATQASTMCSSPWSCGG